MNGIGKKLDLVRRAVDSIRASIPSDQFAGQPPQVRDAVRAYRAIAAPINRYVATMNGEGLLGYLNVPDSMTLDDIQAAYVNECEALNRSIARRNRLGRLRER